MTNNTLTLADPQPNVNIRPGMLEYEPAHVSRYLITARLIKQIVRNKPGAKILDVGGSKGLLREFDIRSTIIDLEKSSEEDYVQGDALNMPFADNSFDAVVSCDVLEHIPKDHRKKFIEEMLRVTKGYVVICAPFDQPGVADSEKKANQFYKSISKKDHRWLIEHIENGLPDEKTMEQYLKKQKLSYQLFRHLSLELWDMTTKIHFLSAVFGDSRDVTALTREAYGKYYADLCELDYSDNGYRTFCVINKNGAVTVNLPEKDAQDKAKTEYKEFLNEKLLTCLMATSIDKRANDKNAASIQARLKKQALKESQAEAELREIKNSKSWKLARSIRNARNFYR